MATNLRVLVALLFLALTTSAFAETPAECEPDSPCRQCQHTCYVAADQCMQACPDYKACSGWRGHVPEHSADNCKAYDECVKPCNIAAERCYKPCNKKKGRVR